MWPAELAMNATILQLVDTLPIEDLHSDYKKELAREIERS